MRRDAHSTAVLFESKTTLVYLIKRDKERDKNQQNKFRFILQGERRAFSYAECFRQNTRANNILYGANIVSSARQMPIIT